MTNGELIITFLISILGMNQNIPQLVGWILIMIIIIVRAFL